MTRAAIAPIVILGLLVALVAQQHSLIVRPAAVGVAAWPVPQRTSGAVELGVTTGVLAANSWRAWQPTDLGTVNGFEQAARRHVGIVMWYADWQRGQVLTSQLDAVARRHSVPEITWEPWDSTKALRVAQPKYELRNIIAGKFDAYIRTWAQRLAAWGKPVRLRFAQEMNGNWYPWGTANGNRPGEFVRAWRHVHHIFTLAGASNVLWVWSPVAGAPRAFFPGAKEVDVLGITCLNGGTDAFSKGWRSFSSICGGSIQQLHSLAPHLPIEISEAGSTAAGGDKARWIASMFSFLARHPEVQSMNTFDVRKRGVDWRIQSSLRAQRSFASADRVEAPRLEVVQRGAVYGPASRTSLAGRCGRISDRAAHGADACSTTGGSSGPQPHLGRLVAGWPHQASAVAAGARSSRLWPCWRSACWRSVPAQRWLRPRPRRRPHLRTRPSAAIAHNTGDTRGSTTDTVTSADQWRESPGW